MDPRDGRSGSETPAPSRPNPGVSATRCADSVNCARYRSAPAIATGMLCAVNTRRADWRSGGGKTVERVTDVARVGVDEALVGVPVADIRDGHILKPRAGNLRPGVDDVLAVLRAARVRTVRRADEADRPSHAILRHRSQRVRQQRMPVAHPEVHREVDALCVESRLQPVDLPARDRGQWRHAAEELVVFGDGLYSFRRGRDGLGARWPETAGYRRGLLVRRRRSQGRRRTAGRSPYDTPNRRRITSPRYRKIFLSVAAMKRRLASRPRIPSGGV